MVYDIVAGFVGDMSAKDTREGMANTLKSLMEKAEAKDRFLAEKASGNITSRTPEELNDKLDRMDEEMKGKQDLYAKYSTTVDGLTEVIKSQHELATSEYSKQIQEGKADLNNLAIHQLAKIMDSVSDPSQLSEEQIQRMVEIYTNGGYTSDFIKYSQQWKWGYASDSNR